MPQHKLKNNFAGVITGASSGIGKALAIMLAKNYKARLVLNARSQSSLEQTADAVKQAGGGAILVPGDIANTEIATGIVDECVKKFGNIDLLVNNAGLTKPGSLLLLKPADWQSVMAVNFFGPLQSIYQALPHMMKAGGGKIVNVSSVAGKIAFPGSVCYAASKFAVTAMSEGMAAELARKDIDFITVCPGWVRTEFFDKNKMQDGRNPTKIASQKNWQGWVMRNILSISSQECAEEILRAIEKGGSQELVLTAPGVFAVGMSRLAPGLMGKLAARIKI